MKKLLFFFLLAFAVSSFAQTEMINSFDAPPDSGYWEFYQGDNADTLESYMNYEFVDSPLYEGDSAMMITYSAHNSESWGGFVKLEHWKADTTEPYDWSLYDSLSIWYYVADTASEAGRVHFRFNLHEVSDIAPGATVTDVGNVEYWYSFNYILETQEAGWHEMKFALDGVADTDQSGDGRFHLTGWSGIPGNSTLDLDKIAGFSFEVSINGTGAGDSVEGVFLLDNMILHSPGENALVMFNGAVVPGGVTMGLGGWSDQSAEITEEEAYTPETKSIKWNLGSDWTMWDGIYFTFDKINNLGYRWGVDSLKFKIKAEAGTGAIRLVILDDDMDSTGSDLMFEAFYTMQEADMNYDGTWKVVSVALADFDRFGGGYDGSGTVPGEMDSTRVKQVRFIKESNVANKIVYLDDIWTGNPSFDVIAPEAPTFVSVVDGQYVNLITWTDVPGESNESYDVYYSLNPITDIEAEGVEVVTVDVPEGSEEATHILKTPLTDQPVTYYYAVVCQDAAGNSSTVALTDPASITNDGQGFPVINFGAPSNFAVDGDLGEWAAIKPFIMNPADGKSGTVVTNQVIDDSLDLNVKAWVAFDSDYMYFAFDVEDDVVSKDTTIATYLTDGADLFIGLYDWRGPTHTAYQRGAEPDYQFRFVSNAYYLSNLGDTRLGNAGDGNYVFEEKFGSGYTIEGKISFEEIRQVATPDDNLYVPHLGNRIKIDYSINDDDGSQREGILTLSPDNQDQSWAGVERWTYTWVGPYMVDVNDENDQIIDMTYQLNQNYPNPFNPSTTIKYSLAVNDKVTLRVYNLLGQEIATLVNAYQKAGEYQVNFDASKLASGVYFYKLQSGNFVSTKKMLLLK